MKAKMSMLNTRSPINHYMHTYRTQSYAFGIKFVPGVDT